MANLAIIVVRRERKYHASVFLTMFSVIVLNTCLFEHNIFEQKNLLVRLGFETTTYGSKVEIRKHYLVQHGSSIIYLYFLFIILVDPVSCDLRDYDKIL